jgi:hypothetical protein
VGQDAPDRLAGRLVAVAPVDLAPRPAAACGTIGGVSAAAPPEPTDACPGCGSVLVTTDDATLHPGASTSCARLFDTTLDGLREETLGDPSAAAVVALADAAYDAQHPVPGDPARTADSLARLAGALGSDAVAAEAPRPRAWRTTIADVAADLDVVDLPVLVETWARAVHQDWCDTTSRV